MKNNKELLAAFFSSLADLIMDTDTESLSDILKNLENSSSTKTEQIDDNITKYDNTGRITMKEIIKRYDDNDNLVYSKDSTGYEEWWVYDEKDNEIHYKDSDGYEKMVGVR